MSRRPEPRRIDLDGAPVVVLTPEEYERLALSRRQLGGQSSRMSGLNRDLTMAAHLLEDARAALCATEEGSDDCLTKHSGEASDRLCCRIQALLNSPRFIAVSGSPAPADTPPKSQRGTRRNTGR